MIIFTLASRYLHIYTVTNVSSIPATHIYTLQIMHKHHTQSLIAVIKQLNLEQQLLMWRVGVLAGSIIITD